MSHIFLISLNQRNASHSFMTPWAFHEDEKISFLKTLRSLPGVSECFLLQTCQRSEIVWVSPTPTVSLFKDILNLWMEWKSCPKDLESVIPHFQIFEEERAVRHFFEVASGLDSAIIGEREILCQIKKAYFNAQTAGTLGPGLHLWVQKVLKAGKNVRSKTSISEGGASLGWAVVAHALHWAKTLENKTVLILGSGDLAKSVVLHFKKRHLKRLMVCSRTENHAETLAKIVDADVVPWNQRYLGLLESDVCACATGSLEWVLNALELNQELDKNDPSLSLKPHLLFDLSMPENTDPAIATIQGYERIALELLHHQLERTRWQRENCMSEAKALLNTQIEHYQRKKNKKQEWVIR